MSENENDIFFTITKYLIERNFTIKEFSNMVFKRILYEMPLLENISLEELNNTIKSYFTENKIDEQYIITMVKSMIKKYRSDISIDDLLNSNYQFGYNFEAINGIEGKIVFQGELDSSSEKTSIDLINLSNGAYLIQLFNTEFNHTTRITKQ